jgi:nicotinamidase/pyrazinamidase
VRPALLLVDIQNDFCPGGALAVPEGDRVVAVANRLMAICPLAVATKDWHPPGHISFASRHGKPVLSSIETPHGPQVLWPDHCIAASHGAALHPDLASDKLAHIVLKGCDPEIDSYSAFFDNARQKQTDLHAFLQTRGVTDLYLCGLATEYCVLFSALDGLDLGYGVCIVTDGCRGVEVRPGDCERALSRVVAQGGRRQSAAATIEELKRR